MRLQRLVPRTLLAANALAIPMAAISAGDSYECNRMADRQAIEAADSAKSRAESEMYQACMAFGAIFYIYCSQGVPAKAQNVWFNTYNSTYNSVYNSCMAA